MTSDYIRQIVQGALVLAILCALLVSHYAGFFAGLSVLAGAAWGSANLLLIEQSVKNLLFSGSKNHLKIFTFLGLKFPFLYFIGYCLLAARDLPPLGILIGFSHLFFAILLKEVSGLFFRTSTFLFALTLGAVKLNAVEDDFDPDLGPDLEAEVPEVPNLISLLYHNFQESAWAVFLKEWENIFFSILLAIAISLVFFLGAKKRALIPAGLQNFLEMIIENLHKFIIEILGPGGEKFVPFLGTLFIYILCMNWAILIPLMKPPSSSLSITIALSLCVFALVQYQNIKNFGFFGFLYHMAGSPKGAMEWLLVPLMFSIEVLTQFTRPFTLALRLFGNVLGEDILIGVFALFGVTLFSAYSPIGLPLQIPFLFLSVLTGLMQALVFTLLSTIYILLSMPESEENHHI